MAGMLVVCAAFACLSVGCFFDASFGSGAGIVMGAMSLFFGAVAVWIGVEGVIESRGGRK